MEFEGLRADILNASRGAEAARKLRIADNRAVLERMFRPFNTLCTALNEGFGDTGPKIVISETKNTPKGGAWFSIILQRGDGSSYNLSVLYGANGGMGITLAGLDREATDYLHFNGAATDSDRTTIDGEKSEMVIETLGAVMQRFFGYQIDAPKR